MMAAADRKSYHLTASPRVAGLLFVVSSLASAQAEPVATVNGEPVERESLLERLIITYGNVVLDRLVDEMIVDQEARRLGLKVADEEVETRLKEMREAVPSGQSLENQLMAQGLTLAAVRHRLRMEMQLEKMVTGELQVTDAEAREFFEFRRSMFDKPAQVLLREILVAKRSTAEQILALLQQGAAFETVAKQYSTSGTASRGGDLGWHNLTEYVNLDLPLKKDALSGVIQAEDGFRIYKVVDVKPGRPASFSEAKGKAREACRREKLMKAMASRFNDLKAKAKVEKLLRSDASGFHDNKEDAAR